MRALAALVLGGILAGMAATAQADEFFLRAGSYLVRVDTRIRADDPANGGGSSVDFDRELGLDNDAAIAFAALAWRPWDKHEFELSYYRASLDGMRRLQHEIDYRGERFTVDTTVRSDFGLQAVGLHYTWWPWRERHWTLGVRFGVLDYTMSAGIRALISADDDGRVTSPRIGVRDELPVPSIGLEYRWMLATDWRLYAGAGWFQADTGNVSPVVVAARVGVEYLPWEEFGLWADLGVHDISADVRSSELVGALRIVERGVRFGVIWRP